MGISRISLGWRADVPMPFNSGPKQLRFLRLKIARSPFLGEAFGGKGCSPNRHVCLDFRLSCFYLVSLNG